MSDQPLRDPKAERPASGAPFRSGEGEPGGGAFSGTSGAAAGATAISGTGVGVGGNSDYDLAMYLIIWPITMAMTSFGRK